MFYPWIHKGLEPERLANPLKRGEALALGPVSKKDDLCASEPLWPERTANPSMEGWDSPILGSTPMPLLWWQTWLLSLKAFICTSPVLCHDYISGSDVTPPYITGVRLPDRGHSIGGFQISDPLSCYDTFDGVM